MAQAQLKYAEMARLSVLASLVKAVYSRDHPNGERLDGEEQRHWNSHFFITSTDAQQVHKLGLAFFLRKDPHPNKAAPRLVIAFRGTQLCSQDLLADLRIGHDLLEQSSRVRHTKDQVLQVITQFLALPAATPDQICLAGHSLGAQIALLVGMYMYSTQGYNLDTHLFNSPSLSAISIVTGKFLPKQMTASSNQSSLTIEPHQNLFAAVGHELLEVFGSSAMNKEWQEFQNLSDWTPHFYLHSNDVVCHQYIEWYTKRHGIDVKMTDVLSKQGIVSRRLLVTRHVLGKKAKYFGCAVPSANLYISNEIDVKCMGDRIKLQMAAHALQQWLSFREIDIKSRLKSIPARLLARVRNSQEEDHHVEDHQHHVEHRFEVVCRSVQRSVHEFVGEVGHGVHRGVSHVGHEVHDVVGGIGHGVHSVVGHIVGDGSEVHQFVGEVGHGVHHAVANVAHGVHDLVGGIGMKVHTKIGNKIFKRMSLG